MTMTAYTAMAFSAFVISPRVSIENARVPKLRMGEVFGSLFALIERQINRMATDAHGLIFWSVEQSPPAI